MTAATLPKCGSRSFYLTRADNVTFQVNAVTFRSSSTDIAKYIALTFWAKSTYYFLISKIIRTLAE